MMNAVGQTPKDENDTRTKQCDADRPRPSNLQSHDAQTRNPRPQTPQPKPETRNSQLETRNFKPRRRLKYVILHAVVPPLVAGALRLLRRTLRIEYRNDERVLALTGKKLPIVFAFWHGEMLMALFTACDYARRQVGRYAALASLSEDGELLARTLQRFRFDAVRGSSRHGARSGLKGLERYLANGGNVGVAVDGPLGPRHSAKMGVALLARNTGAPILPFTVQYERSWRLRSWDRTEIPRPFSRTVVTFHEPITVPPAADRDELERIRARIEQILLGGTTKGSP